MSKVQQAHGIQLTNNNFTYICVHFQENFSKMINLKNLSAANEKQFFLLILKIRLLRFPMNMYRGVI